MYPQLRIDLAKIRKNLDTVVSIAKQGGCSLMIVTKSFCADEHIVGEILKNDYVSYLADSRVKNLASYVDKVHMAGKETVLLRDRGRRALRGHLPEFGDRDDTPAGRGSGPPE